MKLSVLLEELPSAYQSIVEFIALGECYTDEEALTWLNSEPRVELNCCGGFDVRVGEFVYSFDSRGVVL
jgi:hypothetical protein